MLCVVKCIRLSVVHSENTDNTPSDNTVIIHVQLLLLLLLLLRTPAALVVFSESIIDAYDVILSSVFFSANERSSSHIRRVKDLARISSVIE